LLKLNFQTANSAKPWLLTSAIGLSEGHNLLLQVQARCCIVRVTTA